MNSDDQLSSPGHGPLFTRIKLALLDFMLFLLRLEFSLMALLQLRRRYSLLSFFPIMTFLEQTTLGFLPLAQVGLCRGSSAATILRLQRSSIGRNRLDIRTVHRIFSRRAAAHMRLGGRIDFAHLYMRHPMAGSFFDAS